MTRRRLAPLALLGVPLLLSCAPPKSDHPLSDPATARIDTRLEGAWVGRAFGEADETAWIHFARANDHEKYTGASRAAG